MSTPHTPQSDGSGHDPMLPSWRDTPSYAEDVTADPPSEPEANDVVPQQDSASDAAIDTDHPAAADETALPDETAAQEDADPSGSATTEIPVAEPDEADDTTALPATDPESTAADAEATAAVPMAPPTQQWVRGPSPFTVAVGLIFLIGAVLAIGAETQDWSPDWALVGPGTVAAIGLLLAAAGIAAAVRRRTD